MSVWSIVLAGGKGSRYGRRVPKQYESLHGRRVLDWSLDSARSVSDGVVLVVGEDFADQAEPGADIVAVGGTERADSVRAGLEMVPDDVDIVVVHDAVRPLAGAGLFETVVGAVLAGADGAIPGLPVTDTIKRVVDERIVETLDRTELMAVQTPQAFRADILREAHADGTDATDDATLVEEAGGFVLVVPGDPRNLKITHAHDLAVAVAFLR